MKRLVTSFLSEETGGTAAEFAMVLPVMLAFLFGTVDIGRLMWTWNQAEKATQMGVRFAVSTDIVASGLSTYSFATSGGIPQGDPIPVTSFGGATCKITSGSVACTCDTANCPPLGTPNTNAFNRIVTRMEYFLPGLVANNIEVNYGFSGLGYAGNPNGPDVAPLVEVKLRGLQFTPITTLLFVSVPLPDFRAALTLEDGSGTVSN